MLATLRVTLSAVSVLAQSQLELPRCPYCSVDLPSLIARAHFESQSHQGWNRRVWGLYCCQRCGGMIVAGGAAWNQPTSCVFPAVSDVDDALPARARAFLQQAIGSQHAPSGAIMLAASAVDAMLRAKNLTEGSLYSRIDKAAQTHIITSEMARWAHEVRLDANEQRHADDDVPLPDESDARRAIDFVLALGQILFSLPAKIANGLRDARGPASSATGSDSSRLLKNHA